MVLATNSLTPLAIFMKNTFEWKTNYVGGFVQYNLPLLDERLFINPAIELLTLFSGKQFSFGEVYKLGDEKEFTGAWCISKIWGDLYGC